MRETCYRASNAVHLFNAVLVASTHYVYSDIRIEMRWRRFGLLTHHWLSELPRADRFLLIGVRLLTPTLVVGDGRSTNSSRETTEIDATFPLLQCGDINAVCLGHNVFQDFLSFTVSLLPQM